VCERKERTLWVVVDAVHRQSFEGTFCVEV